MRMPVIFQSEGAECGLACLAMIAAHHGISADMAVLRQRFSISMRGATLGQLIRIASQLGLTARAVRVELEAVAQLQLPCMLHWGFNHFVVLRSLKRRSAVLHDPASGVREVSLRELSEQFTGVAVDFTPAPERSRSDLQRSWSWRDLLGPVTGLKRSIGQVLLLALMLELLSLAGPLFLQVILDQVVQSGDRLLLAWLASGFLVLVVFQQAIAALRSWAVNYLSSDLNLQWLNTLFAHLVRLPVTFFERRHLGDVVSRFEAVNTIQGKLSTSLIEAVIDGVMALITLLVMLRYAPGLAALSLAAVAIYVIVRFALLGPMRSAGEEAATHAAVQRSQFLETVRGIASIKLFNRTNERRTRWLNVYIDQVNAEVRSSRLAIVGKAGQGLLFGVEKIIVVWLGALAVIDGQITAGMLVAFVAFRDQFSTRVVALIDKSMEIGILGVEADRLADIALAEPEDQGRAGSAIPADEPLVLKLSSLLFRYADEEPFVLRDCSAEFRSGDYVAIVAPSGAGKTTFVKILLGLLRPEAGEISVNDTPIDVWGLEAYRDLFGVVLQDDELFAGSIASNIAFFEIQPDIQRVEQCARLALIHDDVMRMPMKYHTLVGDMGNVLSGGQRQRILVARALYKRPRILVLDEATSNLDPEREASLSTAIAALDLTRIIISHRPDTISRAHRVLYLVNGRLVEADEFLASS
jgi:ATP-binding cassette subfamily B protein RaxB